MPEETPAGTVVEPTPPVTEEPVVLSQQQEEEKRLQKLRNDEEAKHRLFRRQWKQKMAELTQTGATPEQVAAVKAEMQAQGLVGTDAESEGTATKQATLIANSNARLNAEREQKANEIRRTAANEILAGTLKELGYEPGSAGYQTLGQALFNRHGTDNPDIYADKELVEREAEAIAATLLRKTGPKNALDGAVIVAAGAPKPAVESRHPPAAAGTSAEVKAYAAERGISEAAAKRQMELQKQLPKFGKR